MLSANIFTYERYKKLKLSRSLTHTRHINVHILMAILIMQERGRDATRARERQGLGGEFMD